MGGFTAQLTDDLKARMTLCEDEKSMGAVRFADDGIHLPMAGECPLFDAMRPSFDRLTSWRFGWAANTAARFAWLEKVFPRDIRDVIGADIAVQGGCGNRPLIRAA